MSCTNNLKQIGLAIHNFHDTQDGVPPIILSTWTMSVFPMLWPYIEQQANYDLVLSTKDTLGYTGINIHPSGDAWWGSQFDATTGLDDTKRKGIASVSAYHCPSLRKGSAATEARGQWYEGPQMDYAVVVAVKPGQDADGQPWGFGNQGADVGIKNSSPFRKSKHIEKDTFTMTDWSCRDNFGYWRDGLSNQIIVGEKHFTPTYSPGFTFDDARFDGFPGNGSDGNYMLCYQNCFNCTSFARTFYFPSFGYEFQAYADDHDPVNNPYPMYWFGEAHTGTANFLYGDGSVHPISITTSAELLNWLSCVNDGNAVSMP